ncbi:phosphoserine phosphatase SerB [Kushneria aurantia]|uniref:Phosphoserine phosphatase n=1 Tax=Kushneria aurantia TaxID=504092 RepID=A0ABV6G6M1_9GAMM|nr:phosphoserine phosphatase SerB [Kushneria aurantia]
MSASPSNDATPNLVVTLLAPHLTAPMQVAVEQLLVQHGLVVRHVERLATAGSDGTGLCCDGLELWVSGEPPDSDALRREMLSLGAEQGMDIVMQAENGWRHRRRLVCFDMDSTLIKAEVIDELARRHGVYDEVAAVTERAMRGEIDFQQSFRERMSKLAGLDESVLQEIADGLELMDGVETLMCHLKRLGYRTAILSGGFSWFARYLQQRLGVDEVHANELLIDARGRVTGEVGEPIVDAERKAQLLGEIAARHDIDMAQTVAVGDGANDLKMLAAAGLGIAFRAKPLVRERARQSISKSGLDSILLLLGHHQRELTANA